jgi:mono/diheme cytochrome c family protein
MKWVVFLFCGTTLLLLSNLHAEAKNSVAVDRVVNPVEYSRGQRLFHLNCAACHGKQGEGAPNWRKPDESGKNPAPPLNGTGHTWHHSEKALTNVIRNGTGKIGGNMPAWKDKLSESEIKLILTWIKAQWPDELYSAWYNRFHKQ